METQVRPSIDPRIRQRRIAVRREEGRKRLRMLVGVSVVSCLIAGGWAASRSPLLDVDRVDVAGASSTPTEEITAGLGVDIGQAMVDVDEREAEQALEALPWILDASVERQWPSAVVVSVTERDPVAAVVASGVGYALVDVSGQVLGLVGSPPQAMVVLEGLAPAGPPGSVMGGPAADLLAVAAAIGPELAGRIAAVRVSGAGVSGAGGVELALKPQGVALLGAPERVGSKLAALLAVVSQVDTSDVSTIDVRVPESPALTRLNQVAKLSTHGTG